MGSPIQGLWGLSEALLTLLSSGVAMHSPPRTTGRQARSAQQPYSAALPGEAKHQRLGGRAAPTRTLCVGLAVSTPCRVTGTLDLRRGLPGLCHGIGRSQR